MMKACKVKFVLIRLINGKFIPQQQECYDFVQTLWNGGNINPQAIFINGLDRADVLIITNKSMSPKIFLHSYRDI